MTKLPKHKKFFDFSDYARPFALILVKLLMPTKIGAYSISFTFLVVGMLAAYLILIDKYLTIAAILILLKSMLDAADGEIARQRNEPSMVEYQTGIPKEMPGSNQQPQKINLLPSWGSHYRCSIALVGLVLIP